MFPSEYIPDAMHTCAIPVQGGEEICTSKHIPYPSFSSKVGYRIVVPPGRYTVYSQVDADYTTDTEMLNYRAFYTYAVPCGLSIDCKDHTPIVVEVKPGGTAKNVVPGDWYAG